MARGAREQAGDDPVGPDRRRPPRARLDPAVRRPGVRPALARLFDLAPLHETDRPGGDTKPSLRLADWLVPHLLVEEARYGRPNVRLRPLSRNRMGCARISHHLERLLR